MNSEMNNATAHASTNMEKLADNLLMTKIFPLLLCLVGDNWGRRGAALRSDDDAQLTCQPPSRYLIGAHGRAAVMKCEILTTGGFMMHSSENHSSNKRRKTRFSTELEREFFPLLFVPPHGYINFSSASICFCSIPFL
jgi:hypothetical protein